MIFRFVFIILFAAVISGETQGQARQSIIQGFDSRIREYIDTLRVIDNHEHLFPPEILKQTQFFDFISLFQQYGYDCLISAGMPPSYFNSLFNEEIAPEKKWELIEPFWNMTFNTSINRLILLSIKNLYGISTLNSHTVGPLSEKIREAYNNGDWFDRILRDSCRIDYVIQDGFEIPGKEDYFRYAQRFDAWLTTKSRYRIDSLAMRQLDPVYTLEDYEKSMRVEFEKQYEKGMAAVKIVVAYVRPLNFEKTNTEAARKVFRNLVNGDMGHSISFSEAKPLQDYMLFKLLDLARDYKVPVAFHTGLQAGYSNISNISSPLAMTNLFLEYPGINFILFHGSYPYGGDLSAVAKNFPNVYIDMNWIYSVAPSYTERYLNEWLEMVPASKLIAFGGDMMSVENVYSEVVTAKQIISNVLCNKVEHGYVTENEAKVIAKMILRDNAARLYNLK
ncbi:MAG: amidohydrolase family protein [Bacteroidota bacterium]